MRSLFFNPLKRHIVPLAKIMRSRQSTFLSSPLLSISSEVQDAVKMGLPVVALETTIYTHGFPYPENVELSSLLENTVRNNGGIPATIGVLDGVARVGMDSKEIEELLGTAGNPDTIKLSRKDLGYICGMKINGRKLNGGTTIAGTLVLAHLAGIKVFATGGLGGVHKNGHISMDISADLTELGRTPIALVSSGCKSFLDIPRTLEYLETQGVGVSTFADGRDGSVDFPAFWTRESGVRSPTVVKDEREAAAILYAQLNLPLTSGLLFANPIQSEHSLPRAKMNEVMAQALQDAEREGVSGADNTPFVLSRIRQITQGATVRANRALVESNVLKGTKLAVELAKLESLRRDSLSSEIQIYTGLVASGKKSPQQAHKEQFRALETEGPKRDYSASLDFENNIDLMVAGSIAIDLNCNYDPFNQPSVVESYPAMNTSNPAVITQGLGGVGQNVCTASHYFGARTHLCSVIGDDAPGRSALRTLRERGMSTSGISITKSEKSTAQYVAINGAKKELVIAMADMRILEGDQPAFEMLWEPQLKQLKPKWLILDANWDCSVLKKWLVAGRKIGAKVAYEPVSVPKSTRILQDSWKSHLGSIVQHQLLQGDSQGFSHMSLADMITPNELELNAMSDQMHAIDAWSSFIAAISVETLQQSFRDHLGEVCHAISFQTIFNALKLLSHFPCVLTKLGSNGILHAEFLQYRDHRLSSLDDAPFIFCRHSQERPEHNARCQPPLIIPDLDPASSLKRVAGVYLRHFPAAETIQSDGIVNVNGAGDTFLGILVAGLAQGLAKTADQLIPYAQRGAIMTLKNEDSVSPELKLLSTEVLKKG